MLLLLRLPPELLWETAQFLPLQAQLRLQETCRCARAVFDLRNIHATAARARTWLVSNASWSGGIRHPPPSPQTVAAFPDAFIEAVIAEHGFASHSLFARVWYDRRPGYLILNTRTNVMDRRLVEIAVRLVSRSGGVRGGGPIAPHIIRFGETVYLAAARSGDAHLMLRLIPHIDPAVHDNLAFSLAAAFGHVNIIRLLLALGQRVDPAASRNAALMNAAYRGHVEVVRTLLADSRCDPGDQDGSAMIAASDRGYVDVVRLLLESGQANLRAAPQLGQSSIGAAWRNGHVDVVRLLIATGQIEASVCRRYRAKLGLAA